MPRQTASWCVAISCVLSAPIVALAHSIDPGHDLFQVAPGTKADFAPQPIPANFFDPGSLPFDGIIHFAGEPMPYAPCPLDPLASVIILRPIVSNPPDIIPIELVQLSLVSVNPIVVHYDFGLDELWDVRVRLAPIPVPQSTMTPRHEFPNGGTFDSQLFVYPHFIFTRVGSGDVRMYDPIGPFPYSAAGVPWEHVVPPPGSCRSNFCENPFGLTTFAGPFGQLVLSSICPGGVVSAPEDEAWTWGQVKSSYR